MEKRKANAAILKAFEATPTAQPVESIDNKSVVIVNANKAFIEDFLKSRAAQTHIIINTQPINIKQEYNIQNINSACAIGNSKAIYGNTVSVIGNNSTNNIASVIGNNNTANVNGLGETSDLLDFLLNEIQEQNQQIKSLIEIIKDLTTNK